MAESRNCLKWPTMAKNGLKWLDMFGNCTND